MTAVVPIRVDGCAPTLEQSDLWAAILPATSGLDAWARVVAAGGSDRWPGVTPRAIDALWLVTRPKPRPEVPRALERCGYRR